MQEFVFSPTDFVASLNQTLEYAYPSVLLEGEIANFRISKNKWVYFDVKDDLASVKCFCTVYMLSGPLEDGMMIRLRANARLHPQFGFSLNILALQPVGEGSIKKASELLFRKLQSEGLFSPERKRLLPFAPEEIGLITSAESAAYADFVKVSNARWGGLKLFLYNVQVQGEVAPLQIVEAIEYFNTHKPDLKVLVITRGGGSADDLAAFSDERVVRAVAASRIPTLVAIGHEVDESLAELAADKRASTPSNAAEVLLPEKKHERYVIEGTAQAFRLKMQQLIDSERAENVQHASILQKSVTTALLYQKQWLTSKRQLIEALSPQAALKRGYALVFDQKRQLIRRALQLSSGDRLTIHFSDDSKDVIVQ